MNTREYQMNKDYKPVTVSWYWITLFFIALSVLWIYGMHLTNEQLALGAV
jgi:hypothetical protein